jgi:hypothetical protein
MAYAVGGIAFRFAPRNEAASSRIQGEDTGTWGTKTQYSEKVAQKRT